MRGLQGQESVEVTDVARDEAKARPSGRDDRGVGLIEVVPVSGGEVVAPDDGYGLRG
jgi:hypothetical protein